MKRKRARRMRPAAPARPRRRPWWLLLLALLFLLVGVGWYLFPLLWGWRFAARAWVAAYCPSDYVDVILALMQLVGVGGFVVLVVMLVWPEWWLPALRWPGGIRDVNDRDDPRTWGTGCGPAGGRKGTDE